MTWKPKFVSDLKTVIVTVASGLITAALIWEASSLMSIEKRLARIETALHIHMGADFADGKP